MVVHNKYFLPCVHTYFGYLIKRISCLSGKDNKLIIFNYDTLFCLNKINSINNDIYKQFKNLYYICG